MPFLPIMEQIGKDSTDGEQQYTKGTRVKPGFVWFATFMYTISVIYLVQRCLPSLPILEHWPFLAEIWHISHPVEQECCFCQIWSNEEFPWPQVVENVFQNVPILSQTHSEAQPYGNQSSVALQ